MLTRHHVCHGTRALLEIIWFVGGYALITFPFGKGFEGAMIGGIFSEAYPLMRGSGVGSYEADFFIRWNI